MTGYLSSNADNLSTPGGTREPEFRLPAMTIGLITTPLALALYGAGIECEWHWIVPTVALGLLSFSIAQATNVSLVYIVDSYRPVAGETVVTQLAFKCKHLPPRTRSIIPSLLTSCLAQRRLASCCLFTQILGSMRMDTKTLSGRWPEYLLLCWCSGFPCSYMESASGMRVCPGRS